MPVVQALHFTARQRNPEQEATCPRSYCSGMAQPGLACQAISLHGLVTCFAYCLKDKGT